MSDAEEYLRRHRPLRTDPAGYLEYCNQSLATDPADAASALFGRHQAWDRLGRPDLALADLDRSNALRPHAICHMARGRLLMGMGRHAEALKDYDKAQAMAPDEWIDCRVPFFRADCHARLGNEAAALADCADLPEQHYDSGAFDAPAGDKQQVIDEIRRRARAAARRN